MSSKPGSGLLDARKRIADGGEPLVSETRSINSEGRGGATLKHSVPSIAVEVLSLTSEDDVRIDVYENGYFVQKVGDGDGE